MLLPDNSNLRERLPPTELTPPTPAECVSLQVTHPLGAGFACALNVAPGALARHLSAFAHAS
jgi:hypothetical protein